MRHRCGLDRDLSQRGNGRQTGPRSDGAGPVLPTSTRCADVAAASHGMYFRRSGSSERARAPGEVSWEVGAGSRLRPILLPRRDGWESREHTAPRCAPGRASQVTLVTQSPREGKAVGVFTAPAHRKGSVGCRHSGFYCHRHHRSSLGLRLGGDVPPGPNGVNCGSCFGHGRPRSGRTLTGGLVAMGRFPTFSARRRPVRGT